MIITTTSPDIQTSAYDLARKYKEDEELSRFKESRCLEDITKRELQSAINSGVNFMTFSQTSRYPRLYNIGKLSQYWRY